MLPRSTRDFCNRSPGVMGGSRRGAGGSGTFAIGGYGGLCTSRGAPPERWGPSASVMVTTAVSESYGDDGGFLGFRPPRPESPSGAPEWRGGGSCSSGNSSICDSSRNSIHWPAAKSPRHGHPPPGRRYTATMTRATTDTAVQNTAHFWGVIWYSSVWIFGFRRGYSDGAVAAAVTPPRPSPVRS